MLDDLRHHLGLGCRRQADDRRRCLITGEFLDEAAQISVIRPEIMPPFRYAMRLVDSDERDVQPGQEPVRLHLDPFRGDIQ